MGRVRDEAHARQQRILRLHAQGVSGVEIARRVRVSHQYVSRVLKHPPRSVPCSACGMRIVSAGAHARDIGKALCLDCLAQRPDASFATRLKSLRLAKGLTKTALTAKTGIRPSRLVGYEEG